MWWKILNLADTAPFPGVLGELDAISEVVSLPATVENLERELPRADAYLCALSLRLGEELIQQCGQLKIVCTPSTGWDHLDQESLCRQGVELLSLRGENEFLGSITATAELAWGLLLAVERRLRSAIRLAGEGVWARDGCRGHQLSGKTLGILGYGRLGRIVAEYGRAFRMRVIACDNQRRDDPEGIESVSMDDVLRLSDVLSIHVHLTSENIHLIGREQIARMKPGAVIINTSRGAVIDESALLEALETGHLMGAGLDVIDGEWNTDLPSHPLIRYARDHENLVITPHVGGVTNESQRAAYAFMVGKLKSRILNWDG
jgi:D-3-phosphoglycerate dehydrogenase / 2-oxoglutarate reductase